MHSKSGVWSLAIADLTGVPLDAFEADGIERALAATLRPYIGAIAWRVHRFEPRGVSIVGIAPRGRVIVHTWPERAALTVDVYAEPAEVEAALGASVQALEGYRARRKSDSGVRC